MDSSNEQLLYVRLQEAIKESNHEQVVKIADQILAKKEDDKVVRCRQVALIKVEKISILAQDYAARGGAPTNGDESAQLSYAYYLYLSEKFEEVLKFIATSSFAQALPFALLHAQTLNRLAQYNDAAEAYFKILKKFPKADEFLEILINYSAVAIASNNIMIQETARGIITEAIRVKSIRDSRELTLNFSSLLNALGLRTECEDSQRRYRQLISSEGGEKADEVSAIVQNDSFDQSRNLSLNHEDLEKKLRDYEEFSRIVFTDKNLKVAVANNLVVYRALHKHEQFGDSAKHLDDAIGGKYRQTQEQLLTFKLNKVLLLVQKGKFPESLALLTDIEKSTPSLLESNFRYLTVKAYILSKVKKDELLSSFIETLSTKTLLNPSISESLRFEVFLLLSELSRAHANSPTLILQYFQRLQQGIADKSKLFENEVLCCFILSQIAKVRDAVAATESGERTLPTIVQSILDDILNITVNPRILVYLGDVYAKSNSAVAVQIYTKLTQQFPRESAYHQRLAKLHSAAGDFDKAQALLQNIRFSLITDYSELSKLESEIALSKIDQQHSSTPSAAGVQKKIHKSSTGGITQSQKKQKKRIRFPKNFDPKNPGNPPNPERWLPKWERKDFKKKKGAALNSRTQGSAAAAQDHTSTTKTFAVANTTSHQKATENKKSNNKKKKNK